MIIGCYSGWNVLTVEDSFKITAWESIYSPFADDPLFLSISNFVKICREYNIKVDYPAKHKLLNLDNFSPDVTPLIIIISGYSENKDKLLGLLKRGANLVYIKPEFGITINADKFDKFEKWLFKSLGLSKNGDSFSYNVCKGRFFYLKANQINDYQIEDGPFGKVEQSLIDDKLQKIRTIVKRISRFSIPLVDLNVVSIPSTFPLHEPLLINFSFKNISDVDISSIVLEFHFPKSFEPITSTYWEIDDLKKSRRINIPIYCKPKVKGLISDELLVDVKVDGYYQTNFKICLELKVVDSFRFMLRESIPHNIDTKKLMEKYNIYFKEIVDQGSFMKLIEIDPEGVITKARKISEKLTKIIAQDKLENFNPKWSLSDLIKKLFSQKIINNKIRSYLETIRMFGNIAAHSDIEDPIKFNKEDSILVFNALLMFIKECLNSEILKEE